MTLVEDNFRDFGR